MWKYNEIGVKIETAFLNDDVERQPQTLGPYLCESIFLASSLSHIQRPTTISGFLQPLHHLDPQRLYSPPPKQDLFRTVRYHLCLDHQILRPLDDIIFEFKVVSREEVNHDLLDLEACKSSARTRMFTISKSHIR